MFPGVSRSINAFVSEIINALLLFILETAYPMLSSTSPVRSDVTKAVADVNPLVAMSIISSTAFSIAV